METLIQLNLLFLLRLKTHNCYFICKFEKKLIKTIYVLVISILFFSCKKENDLTLKKNSIDSLFVIANKSKVQLVKNQKANEIYFYLKKKKLDSITKKQYINLVFLYISLNNKKYLNVCEYITSNNDFSKDYNTLAYCNLLLGNYYYSKSNYEKSYYYYLKTNKNSEKSNNFEYQSLAQINNANILLNKFDYIGAEKLAIQALKLTIKYKFDLITYNCYLTLGNTTSGLKNYNKSISYFQKANALSDKLQNEAAYLALASQPLNFLSTVYRKKNDYKTAFLYAQKGLAFDSLKNKEPEIYCYLKNNLAYSKFQLGDKSANKLFLQTLILGDSLQFEPIQITSKTYLGEYYLAQNDTIKANFYLKDAQNQSHEKNIFEDELKILQLLAKANPKKEAFYNQRYITLSDSLQTVERATRNKFARIEFETDEITSEKNKVEKLYEKLNTKFLLLLGFSIFLVTTLYYWFTNKTNKAKTRELLLEQESLKDKQEIYQLMLNQQQKLEEGKQIEKQRISQELHDGVMGKLSSIRMNLFILNKKTDPETIAKCLEYVGEIQNIEKEIRKISHDLNNNLFSNTINFESIVENLFTAIKSHSEINFNLKADENIDWEIINNDTKIHIYRIIQEALQNIDKYAKASLVQITINKMATSIEIKIIDNGVGFNTNSIKNGIGLKNMQSRMLTVGGTFNIESFPKKGTKINLTIPN